MFLIANWYQSCLTPTDLDEILMIHDVAIRHHWLKFAPSPLVMGKSRISAVAPSSPVTQVIWRPVNTMRGTRDRLQKVTPKRKGWHAAKTNQTPTPHVLWTMQEDHQFPDDQQDSPPLDRCKTSKNQVHHVVMICFLCFSRKMPIRTVISRNGFLTSRHISLWCLIWRAPLTPRVCISCGGDGIYRCTDCAHRPVFCAACCRNQHTLQPFHHVQQ